MGTKAQRAPLRFLVRGFLDPLGRPFRVEGVESAQALPVKAFESLPKVGTMAGPQEEGPRTRQVLDSDSAAFLDLEVCDFIGTLC